MSRYVYDPLVWPPLAAAAACTLLALYAWRRRWMPAARSLAVLAALGIPWALGTTAEVASGDVPTGLLWFKFHSIWHLPALTASLWFALEYSDLGRRLTTRKQALIAVPTLGVLLLVLTLDAYHLVGETVGFDRQPSPMPAILGAFTVTYGLLVSLAAMLAFAWLFLQSPPHRLGAALCLLGQFLTRAAFTVDSGSGDPEAHLDLSVLTFPVTAGLYAVALFRFHLFDLIPVAGGTILEQMREGLLVLNPGRQVLFSNPAAERMLAVDGLAMRGRTLAQVLPGATELLSTPDGVDSPDSVVPFVLNGVPYSYAVHHSPLVHARHVHVGSLVLLRDVTREMEARAQLGEQQQALATLRERDRVGRELHDSLGQVLGYAKMQAQASRELLAHRRVHDADTCLQQLVSAVQDAHNDVRDYIVGARAGLLVQGPLFDTLDDYLKRYTASYGITSHLEIDPALSERTFAPAVSSQLIRIIQEALSNVRKHARARDVRIRLVKAVDCAEAIIQDDGRGFDPSQLAAAGGRQFGVQFMHERAQEVGARVCIHSRPGEGAQVIVTFPLAKDAHATAAG